MEYQCRLASATGEIIERVYSADSESKLRHELEEKGLFVLSLRPKGAIAGLRTDRGSGQHERAGGAENASPGKSGHDRSLRTHFQPSSRVKGPPVDTLLDP